MGYDLFVPMMAEGEVVAGTEYQAVIGEMTDVFTASALSGILVYAVGACVGLVLFWWGVRKVSGMFMKAFKKGKLRI